MANNRQRAQSAGQVRFGGKEAQLRTEQQMLDSRINRDLDMLRRWGTTGNQAIDEVYGQAIDDLGKNRETAMQALTQQVERSGRGYESAAQASELVRDEGRQYLENLVRRQGGDAAQIQALAEASTPLEALSANLSERNRRFGQDMQTALGNYAAREDVLYGHGINQMGQERAQALSGFETDIANALAQVSTQGLEGRVDLGSQLASLLGERGAFEVEYAGDLADRDAAMALEQAKLQQAANEFATRMALERAKMADQRSYRQAQLNAAAGEEDWKRQLAFAELGLNRDKFGAQMGQNEFENMLALREQGLRYQPEPSYAGISGIEDYLSGGGSEAAAETARGLQQRVLGAGVDPAQAYQMAIAELERLAPMARGFSKIPGGREFNENEVRKAVDILFGMYR